MTRKEATQYITHINKLKHNFIKHGYKEPLEVWVNKDEFCEAMNQVFPEIGAGNILEFNGMKVVTDMLVERGNAYVAQGKQRINLLIEKIEQIVANAKTLPIRGKKIVIQMNSDDLNEIVNIAYESIGPNAKYSKGDKFMLFGLDVEPKSWINKNDVFLNVIQDTNQIKE